MIQQYKGIAPKGDILLIQKLCEKLRGRCILNINSTRKGGGVAEILQRMTPLLKGLDIDARWEVIEGDDRFFDITKKIHNTLQGNMDMITEDMWDHHHAVNEANSRKIDLDADFVLIHDPQPIPLIEYRKRGFYVWRCHIDVSNPLPDIWQRLERYVRSYDCVIFSVSKFSKSLPVDEFIIPPAIDPLSDKNIELTEEEVKRTMDKLNVPMDKPILLQVSRFDVFKDPIGVINAYRRVKKYNDCRLVLAGSLATDDPEGTRVLNEVRDYAGNDPDIHILLLPPSAAREINALQRAATIVLQKSLKEGFGLTVSEAMWKEKPVVGGAVGGIPYQITHGVTGFLVYSVDGAAFRIRQLLNNPGMRKRIGQKAKEYVRRNFLITRQIRDYLSVWYFLENKGQKAIEL
jgi:trehalose synthase